MSIAAPATAAQYQAAVLASSPSTFWPMGEASGAPQEIVRGLTGIPVGALTYRQPDPWGSRQAFGFDGSSAYFYETTYNPANVTSTPFTLEVWLRSAGVSSPGGCAAMWTVTPTPPLSAGNFSPVLYLLANTGQATGFLSGASPAAISAAGNIADGRWHYVVFTYDGANTAIYVDAQLVASAANVGTGGALLGNACTSVGVSGNANRGGYWRGALSSYAYYRRALSPAELATHFVGGVPPARGGFPGGGFPGDGFPGGGFPDPLS